MTKPKCYLNCKSSVIFYEIENIQFLWSITRETTLAKRMKRKKDKGSHTICNEDKISLSSSNAVFKFGS